LIDMWMNRIVATALIVGVFVGPSTVVAAPIGIDGPVSTASLARAVRVNPPAPPAPPAPAVSSIFSDMLNRVNA